MTHTLRVVCRPSTCTGFALAGVHSIGAVDGPEAAVVLGELVARSDPGVIFVEEPLYRALPATLRERLQRLAVPLVIPFPAPRVGVRASTESELVEMLREAIGYRVRLR